MLMAELYMHFLPGQIERYRSNFLDWRMTQCEWRCVTEMRYDVLGPDDLSVCSPLLCPAVKASQSRDVTRRKQKHFVACDKEEAGWTNWCFL